VTKLKKGDNLKKLFLILILIISDSVCFSQSLSVFDLDGSSFPFLKAKFYCFDDKYNLITNLSTSDFSITENGQSRTVKLISCPSPLPPEPLSSVLVMDQSGSMAQGDKLKVMHEAALAWISALFITKSECAITSFDDDNYIIQDFTANKAVLESRVMTIKANGGTNYDKALLEPAAGGILIAQKGEYKRVVVMLSDGEPNTEPAKAKIISEAQKYNIAIYFVTLMHTCSPAMKEITVQTGGMYFENVSSAEEAKVIYLKILKIAQGGKPCELEWQSNVPCISGNTFVEIKNKKNDATSNFDYAPPPGLIASLVIDPTGVGFKNKPIGIKADTTITIKAQNAVFSVSNISTSTPGFSINPSSFTLNPGESRQLTLSYTPPDSSAVFAKFVIENNLCPENYYASASYNTKKPKKPTLKLLQPNGGEIYPAGNDTLITWEGVLPSDTVKLDYSTDKGITWFKITDTATGLKYLWRNIPNTPSNLCLARISFGDAVPSDNGPNILWQKTYGSLENDEGLKFVTLSDTGFLLTGNSKSRSYDTSHTSGGTDILVIRTDKNGNELWGKLIGGDGDEDATAVIPALDSGLIIVGKTNSTRGTIKQSHGGSDGLIIKLDDFGNIQWSKTIGGSAEDGFFSIIQTYDNGYFLCGYSWSQNDDLSENKGKSDIWVVKLNVDGNIIWQKTYGGSEYDVAYSAKQLADNGFIVAGNSSSEDGDITNHSQSSYNDIWILKLNLNGDLDWQRCYGTNANDNTCSVTVTRDGNYLVSGNTNSISGSIISKGQTDFYILKLDMIGDIIWQQAYGGENFETAYSIVESSSGGYLVAGSTGSFDGDVKRANDNLHLIDDFWLLMLEENGKIKWQKCLGGSAGDYCHSLAETSDGKLVVFGTSYSNDGDVSDNHGSSDFWLVLLNQMEPAQTDVSDSVWSIVSPKLTAHSIDMGKVLVGSTKDSIVTSLITNSGNYQAIIDSIVFYGPSKDEFHLPYGMFPFIVPANDSKEVEFYFSPKTPGLKSSDFNIYYRSDTLSFKITGEGIQPMLEVMVSCLDFGAVKLGKDTTIADTALIKNSGNTIINVTNTVFLPPDYGQFSIINGGGAFSLNPGETRKLSLKFKPQFGGRTSGLLGFEYSDVGSPAKVILLGEGKGGSVYIPDDSAEAGKRKNIRLILGQTKADGIASIASKFKAKIRFEATILSALKKYHPIISNDSVVVEFEGQISKNETLFNFPVTTGLGMVEETVVELLEFNLYDSKDKIVDYNFELKSGKFKLLGICREGGGRFINPKGKAGILILSPNPANDELNISFSTIEEAKTEIVIFNMFGEKVLTAFSEVVSETGTKEMTIQTGNLSTGAYNVVFISPTVYESHPISIIK